MDDIFKWNWKVSEHSPDFFWFEIDENGVFGYCMSHDAVFQAWNETYARAALLTFTRYSSREPIYGPQLSEIPPLILKIRMMTARHERYLERKRHAI